MLEIPPPPQKKMQRVHFLFQNCLNWCFFKGTQLYQWLPMDPTYWQKTDQIWLRGELYHHIGQVQNYREKINKSILVIINSYCMHYSANIFFSSEWNHREGKIVFQLIKLSDILKVYCNFFQILTQIIIF